MIPTTIAIRERIRAQRPLVHILTNAVVKNFTANVLLAAGAAPAMVEDPDEAGQFAGIAQSLLVNLGTLTREQAEAIRRAIDTANTKRTPWVLDPVAVGVITMRTLFARELLLKRPTLIRGNASEIIALAGASGGGRGCDSGVSSDAAIDAAKKLAYDTGATVLVTGKVDYIIGGRELFMVKNGSPMMTRVTGIGCAMGALAAAALAVENNPVKAAVATAAIFGISGEIVARHAKNPGTFAVKFLDMLDALTDKAIHANAIIRK